MISRRKRYAILTVGAIAACLGLAVHVFLRLDSKRADQRRVRQLSARITLLDEILTMSAYMWASTHQERWRARYFEHEPRLDEALTGLLALAPTEAQESFVQRTRSANDALVTLELEALAAADSASALHLLNQTTYEALKRQYKDGMDAFTQRLEQQLAAERTTLRGWFAAFCGLTVLLSAGLFAALNLLLRTVRRSELDLAEALAGAHGANEAKTAFIAKVSHEIRTPLHGILGMGRSLLRTELTAPQRADLGVVIDAAQSLRALVDEILDFSKLEAAKARLSPGPFSPAELADRAVALIKPLAEEKGLSVGVQTDRGLPARMVGDEGRLRQVLDNLLSNARQVHEDGLRHVRGDDIRRRPARLHRPRQRDRYSLRAPASAVPAVFPGRRLGPSALRRHRAGPGCLPPAARPHGRHGRGRQRTRTRYRVSRRGAAADRPGRRRPGAISESGRAPEASRTGDPDRRPGRR